ncbi:hypothetical protein ACROYT_G030755 [Oculina patagonica]
MSPSLFLLVIDWIMRRTTEKRQNGIQWALITRLEDLDFADDIALLSHNHRSMQSKLPRLAKISMPTGLRISKSKTKAIRVKTRNADRIELDGDEIYKVDDFAYLGGPLSSLSAIINGNAYYKRHLHQFLTPAVGSHPQWVLCYRASIYGWAASTFHSRCDGKRDTVTIIKKGQYVFGGYTDIPWGMTYFIYPEINL